MGRKSKWVCVLADNTKAVSFTEFVTLYEQRLRQALTAAFGVERGKDASAEALAYGWEHWDRVSDMGNPAGYLYRVGYDKARRATRKRIRLPAVRPERQAWVEPGLPAAVASLPEKQRVVVVLLHGYQWSMSEVAEYLGVSKGTVQTHGQRGLDRLRKSLGVEL
jgi:RNA polymerase sigma-70 factor (ECF subfamily)